MRLDYNILWIEDDHEWLDTTKKLFEESIDDLGFRLNPTSFKDGDKIDELVVHNGFADFDLILVDFNLQNSQTGNTIIEKLRESEIYTDVLFYSQDIDNVRSSVKELGLEGVYTSGRDGIEDKFEKVVKTTIKKIQEVNTMRGLIMAETSILDDKSLDITSTFINEGTEASSAVVEYIFKTIENSLKEKSDDFTAYKEQFNIEGLLEDTVLFSAIVRSKALNKIGKIKVIDELKNFTDNYSKEVIKIRNVFAHAKEVKEAGKTTLKGSNEEFDYERCIEIRRTLIKYSDLFELVKGKLS
ncbi:response regulator [Spirosoma pollinicola]|uniref:Response regulatory domain-containing protein n=1 Tax=Spirosoma pollinicola TaxID=2057025 RepID=A0A2K8YX61_9BACT|nr:hypothetical protein [Spirosoma pollinicola]AUD02164.1 hypothetical protein CWM47_10230 [Spirosoma pollinicola]